MARPAAPMTHTALVGLWLFSCALLGYPLFGLLTALANTSSGVFSIPFRLGVLALALTLMAMRPQSRRPMSSGEVLLWAFAVIYSLRLTWDSISQIAGAREAALFFVVGTLAPCAALVFSRLDLAAYEYPLARILVGFGGLTCMLAIGMHFLQLGEAQSLTAVTGRLSYTAINPISLGHVATTTLLAAVCLMRHRSSVLGWLAVALLSAAALLCLVLTASRGPVLALGVCAVIYMVATRHWKMIAGAIVAVFFVALGDLGNIEQRFTGWDRDESIHARFALQFAALEDFYRKPVLGSSFLDLTTSSYPHNIFIESAMAMGTVGLLTAILLVFIVILKSLQALHRGEMLVVLLFAQYLFAAQFSGAIYGNAPLWMTMLALLIAPQTPRTAKQHLRRPSITQQCPSTLSPVPP